MSRSPVTIVGLRLPDEGGDHVVGLEALSFIDGEGEGGDDFADLRELVAKLVRHALPRRLVLLEALVAERRLPQVEGDRHRVGLHVLDRPQDDVGEAEDGVDQLALRRRQRRVDQGVVAAIDEPVAVEQHQAGHGGQEPPAGSRHGPGLARRTRPTQCTGRARPGTDHRRPPIVRRGRSS
jgi:hypothetical protein